MYCDYILLKCQYICIFSPQAETVQHIIAGCKMQTGTAYMGRHNQVAGIMYRNICTKVCTDDTSQGG